ncbi:IclR family transcriptional regulator [Arthrobacter sp. PAMC25564]|uniref:IclR family transcriptional regulator n=1 Tax=Arthrobacter sp. PAMC25564 TaxID=2565366 RepID=UPI0010A20EA4|nr:IclR family transcriptional regulator [Arthrobacter sp. PAMC25564]QCB96280.1 IclR family transcriptional regulator [Arthrobacter sp. PAMC25564]
MPRLTPAVLRTLDILELFLDLDSPLTAPDVVRLTGVPRTTAHELLATLVSRDYLQKDEASNTFRLGVRLLQLGNAYSARFDMLAAANDAARELSSLSGETVSVALREGADVFYLAKVESRDKLRLPSSIGQRLPAHVTGLGKALLAYASPTAVRELYPHPDELPAMTGHSIRTLTGLQEELERVRARGVAFEREESTPDVYCAAAPVRDGSGAVVAAISVSVSAAHWHQRPEEYWAELVQQGAARLSAQLGFAEPH